MPSHLRKGLLTAAELASKLKIKVSAISKFSRKGGMPSVMGVMFDLKKVVAWLELNNSKRIPPVWVKDFEQYESQSDFARRNNVCGGTVSKWAQDGLCCASNGWVDIKRGDAWVNQHKKNSRHLPPSDVPTPSEYESRNAFYKRLQIPASGRISKQLARVALPCASNGWVHIQRSLEWIRDNTNIKIPQGAWPKKIRSKCSKSEERSSGSYLQ